MEPEKKQDEPKPAPASTAGKSLPCGVVTLVDHFRRAMEIADRNDSDPVIFDEAIDYVKSTYKGLRPGGPLEQHRIAKQKRAAEKKK